jgi:hypothetical protein
MSLKTCCVSNLVICFYLVMIHTGCDQSSDECDKGYKPYDCIETEPGGGTVRIKVNISNTNPSIPITVFSGKVEQNQIVLEDTLTSGEKEYFLDNGEYAVRAEYRANIDGSWVTVHSVEGGELSPSKKEYCDGNCYSEGTLELDASYP